MRKKIWIKGIDGEFYYFYKPISIGQEIQLLAELSGIRLTYDTLPQVLTTTASVILDLAPELVEQKLSGEELLKIFSSVREDLATEVKLPKRKKEASAKRGRKKDDTPETYEDQVMNLISFLSFYSNLTLSEIMSSPKQFLVDLYFGLLDFIEIERDFEFQISAVSALSALSGESAKTDSKEGEIDLTTERGLEALLSIPDFVEVQNA